jgi:hypothetical protein
MAPSGEPQLMADARFRIWQPVPLQSSLSLLISTACKRPMADAVRFLGTKFVRVLSGRI